MLFRIGERRTEDNTNCAFLLQGQYIYINYKHARPVSVCKALLKCLLHFLFQMQQNGKKRDVFVSHTVSCCAYPLEFFSSWRSVQDQLVARVYSEDRLMVKRNMSQMSSKKFLQYKLYDKHVNKISKNNETIKYSNY